MKILAFDTTGNTASVAIVETENIIAEFSVNCKKNHSLSLMPLISHALNISGLELPDISYVAVSNGPGSFTGLRLSAATAKALAHGAPIKITPVPTLDALAYNILMEKRIVAPIMDARRGEVYACIYLCEDGILKPLTPYLNEEFSVFLDRVKALNSPVSFLGDGCLSHRDVIMRSGFDITSHNNLLQRASSVGFLALKYADEGKLVGYNELELLYLRKPQAEREYEARREYEEKNDRNTTTTL